MTSSGQVHYCWKPRHAVQIVSENLQNSYEFKNIHDWSSENLQNSYEFKKYS